MGEHAELCQKYYKLLCHLLQNIHIFILILLYLRFSTAKTPEFRCHTTKNPVKISRDFCL